MSFADRRSRNVQQENWQAWSQRSNSSIEILEFLSGASLILSRFEPGATRSFKCTEPEDIFGFGFHLRGGARFAMETNRFETRAFEVWACASPKGSTSEFVLPADGFLTVSIRFKPTRAEEFFAQGLALPKNVHAILKRVRESTGSVRLQNALSPFQAKRLETMFTMPYEGAARRLYLESWALELLAGQVASLSDQSKPRCWVQFRHREQAFAAREYLEQQFHDPPTISELAKIVGSNEFTLKRAFKQTHGTTIFAFVARRRMEHATFLLEQGMTVSSVAQEVGYRCVRSFSVAFRRQIGCSPSEIRRGRR